jgi:hypothetical protein
MEFRHSCIGEILSAAHSVSEMHTPAISFIDVRQCSSDTTLRHDSVCFAKQGFAHESHLKIAYSGFNGSTKSSTTGSDYQYIIFMRFVRCHANVSSFFSTIDVF